MTAPKVFISYSHDSLEHKKWVLDFATRLRNSGIDAVLDQWELGPGGDLPHFMETNLAAADRILIVCTEKYVKKANSGSGGVGYEKMIVTSDMMQSIDSKKVIPIIRQNGTTQVPTFLKTKKYVDFSFDDNNEYSFDELARDLLDAPIFQKPPIGNAPYKSVQDSPAEKTSDLLRDLMQTIVTDFESHAHGWVLYSTIVQRVRFSRVVLDTIISQAAREGLIKLDPQGDIYLTEKGKHFAIQHHLVK